MPWTITAAMLDNCSVTDIVANIKNDYGITLVVSVQWYQMFHGAWVSSIVINFADAQSRKDAHDMEAQVTPLLATDVMTIEKQVKFALMLWEQALDRHMR